MQVFRNLATIRVFTFTLFALTLFITLRIVFAPRDLIIMLNGLFVGSLSAVAVAYAPLFWGAFWGLEPYDRVRQMTLSFFLQWLALGIAAGSSIYLYTLDLPTSALTSVGLSRYIAIWAAVAQIYAPDWGLGVFHGRDRKMLTLSLGIGFLVSCAVVIIQKV